MSYQTFLSVIVLSAKNFFTIFIMNMNISNQTGLSFQGYDVLPLRALYMQGIRKRGEVNIFREMKRIAQIEGLELYLNQDGQNIVKDFGKISGLSKHLPIWGQDNKAFVVNKNGKTILWNSKEYSINPEGLGELGDYKIDEKPYMPRGGDYYLGYKPNGEKWLLINGFSIYDKKSFKDFGDLPTKKILYDLFDVKPKNVITINSFSSDLDEFVRPIGFPYILVNDYNLSLENLEKMKNKFPNSHEPYIELKKFLTEKLNQVQSSQVENDCDTICQILSDYGFKPIRIGGRYSDDINYMNAIAFQNNKNGISYITNSTKNHILN